MSNIHVEGYRVGIVVGAFSASDGEQISNVWLAANLRTSILISKQFSVTNLDIRIAKSQINGGATPPVVNTLYDQINSNTLTCCTANPEAFHYWLDANSIAHLEGGNCTEMTNGYCQDQNGLAYYSGSIAQWTLAPNGSIVAAAYAFQIANNSMTGTTVNKLAILTGAPSTATIALTGSTAGVVGLVIAGAGMTGNATIQFAGIATCVFDSAGSTAGDYVEASTVTGGDCRDAGAAKPTNQTIGRALKTSLGSSSQTVLLMMNQ